METKCLTSIFVKTQFTALHQYKDAPQGVAFLRELHRHIFYVEIEVGVGKTDRDIEFFLMKREVDDAIDEHIMGVEWRCGIPIIGSCEETARIVGEKIIKKMKRGDKEIRTLKVSISEDGENGAIVTFQI